MHKFLKHQYGACYVRFSFLISCENTLMLAQSSTITDYEEYVEEKIYVKNDNDVYEEFMKKEAEEIIKNENGIAIKFPGGAMICFGFATGQANTSNVTVKFPQEFKDSLYSFSAINIYNYSANMDYSISDVKTKSVMVFGFENGKVLQYEWIFRWTAIGEWK